MSFWRSLLHDNENILRRAEICGNERGGRIKFFNKGGKNLEQRFYVS